jgi:hypothetical protein
MFSLEKVKRETTADPLQVRNALPAVVFVNMYVRRLMKKLVD